MGVSFSYGPNRQVMKGSPFLPGGFGRYGFASLERDAFSFVEAMFGHA